MSSTSSFHGFDTARPSQAAALRLSALLIGAGAMHFATPTFFDSTVPRQLPGAARTYTQVSGVAELAIGTALLVPKTRKLGGALAAALFIAVFPANIQMAVDWCRSKKTSTPQKIGSIARLPLQIPLVTEALKARRNAR
ncbi:putative membrane protein [Rhodococcus sp. 27YEA15]|uniref:DoxX family protein n=1 Tax=Rhodococcus sp. 27YEA15 TaxID=3156259 RepID=UPI003C7ADA4F